VGKLTIHYYFKSKNEFFLEVVKKESKTLMSTIKKEVKGAITPQEKFKAVNTRIKYFPNMYENFLHNI